MSDRPDWQVVADRAVALGRGGMTTDELLAAHTRIVSRNPGGWPTGPLLSRFQYDRRDLCNARDDLLLALARAWGIDRLAVWLSARLTRKAGRR